MRHNAGSTACIDKDKWAYALVIWRFLNHSPGRIEASHNKSALPNQRRESLLKRVDRLNQALLPRADDVRIA